MDYIIYYDQNHLDIVNYEIGQFEVLSDGVGLYSADASKKGFPLLSDLSSGMQELLSIYKLNSVNIETLLSKSIFVRFYHKVQGVCDCESFCIDTIMSQLEKFSKEDSIAIRVVYGLNAKRKDITKSLADELINIGYNIDVKNPKIVISIFVGDNVYYSIDYRENLSSNYRGGAPHYAKGEEISRAEFKLVEALDRFNIDLTNIHYAIDLGASPGGWSNTLAKYKIKVCAVDPAELDARVLQNEYIKHYKMSSQDFVNKNTNKYDLIVNDMKMIGGKSSYIVCECADNLQKDAVLLMTIKLATKNMYEQIIETAKLISTQFSIVDIKKLFYNRQEVMLYAKKI